MVQEEEKIQNKSETGEIKFENGDKYFGHIQNGKPHGHGVLTEMDGVKYIGEFKDGEITFGKIKDYDYTYEGEIKNRMAHGKGICIYRSGEKYDGFFKAALKHGFMT